MIAWLCGSAKGHWALENHIGDLYFKHFSFSTLALHVFKKSNDGASSL
jgi:hypothetical protein